MGNLWVMFHWQTMEDLPPYNEEKLPNIFRMDLQIQWKMRYKKMTGSLITVVQNCTNR
jgi:hypothetical protein